MHSMIKVDDLGKRYSLGRYSAPYATVRESITKALRRPFTRFRNGAEGDSKTIWALKDINFDVQAGEIVGVIGRNGAGKSTLLKIISRITEPTTGEVELFGRVGSLLEVGTGFHPELTGKENIYLNAAILGMRRSEINRKFDEIVSFAEIE
ncbi:MAG: ATP-binding cassette domain-containing protein, partial [Acidobacteriota bacterium]|nr:ATP-binding cassette domain-containing protein [Acidobacteriota bacterium]